MNPFKDVARAFTTPLKAVFVVGLCFVISRMTHSGDWWLWVALGMGIASVVSLAKGLRSALLLALVAFVGWKIYQRYGDRARARFDEWVQREQPRAAQVVDLFRRDAGGRFGSENR